MLKMPPVAYPGIGLTVGRRGESPTFAAIVSNADVIPSLYTVLITKLIGLAAAPFTELNTVSTDVLNVSRPS